MYERTYPVSMPDVSDMAAIFADKTRAAMCGALMSGQAWTLGELADFCGIARSSASEQVDTLQRAGVVSELRQGRHRYLTLAGGEVAALIETLAVATHRCLLSPHSLNANRANAVFFAGRTCYNHLAGELGIQLAQQLRAGDFIDKNFQLCPTGVHLCEQWGMENSCQLEGKPCLDSTHRVFHIAGSLGEALCEQFLVKGWIERGRPHRTIKLTALGRQRLSSQGIVFSGI